jgi:ADP-ribosylglycohydrolase
MVMGAYIGDALALGAHWVYNTNVIDKKFGILDRYENPLTSYHTGKKAGDFTHYGDQTTVLLESLAANAGFEGRHFARHWRSFFQGYGGYFDKATKTTLQNMDDRNDLLNSGSPSDDLAGAARIAPVVYVYHADREMLDRCVRSQTAITHNHALVIECAAFFAQTAIGILGGQSPSAAVEKALSSDKWTSPFADLVQQGIDSRHRDTRETIAAFGQMCSAEAALPGTIHLIGTYEADFKQALIKNVMAGGDSSARGMLLGMVLGAHLGMDAIPARWLSELKERKRIEQLMDSLNAGR